MIAALKNVEVVGPADLSFFERLQRSGSFSKQEMKQIKEHILSSESYYIPKARLVYLATLSRSTTPGSSARAANPRGSR